MNQSLQSSLGRAWPSVALALFVGISACSTPGPGASSQPADQPELRVDVKWRLDVASDRLWELNPRELGEPVLSPGGDMAVGTSHGWVYRLHPESGDIRWGKPVDGSVEAAPRLAAGMMFVGTDNAEVVALDWRDGSERWRFETQDAVEMTPTFEGGQLFVTDSGDRLYALDAASGELSWDVGRERPEFFTLKGGGQPLVSDGVVYVGFSDGVLVAYHTDGGDEIWAVELGDEGGEFGDIDLPLVEWGDNLVTISHSGGVYGIDRESGAIDWHADVTDVSGMDFYGGWLFAATATGQVVTIDARSGDTYWRFDLPDNASAMDVSLAGGVVAVTSQDGPMYWLRVTNGALVTKWAPGRGFQRAPIFDERFGYAMSDQGYLYGFTIAY